MQAKPIAEKVLGPKSIWSFGFQHTVLLAGTLVYPVLLGDIVRLTSEARQSLVSYSLVAGGIASILLSSKQKWFGTGLLLLQSASAAYLLPSITAAKSGGLELVFGFTLLAALFQLFFSRFLPFLRTIFTVEISGVVILMVGFSITSFAATRFVGESGLSNKNIPNNVLVGMITLFSIMGLQVWGKGLLKRYAFLIGMAFGYALAYFLESLNQNILHLVAESPILMLPPIGGLAFSSDIQLWLPFLIVAITTSIKVSGDVLAAQKISEPDFKRPDLKRASRGVFASGLGNVMAAFLGGLGGTTMTANVGFAAATKVLDRRVSRTAGLIMIIAAFFPKALLIWALMPAPVLGASLLLLSSFVIITGIQVIASRELDTRKSFMIGLSLLLGLSVEMKPDLFQHVPPMVKPIFQSSLSLATITALLLNMLFRIGIYKRQSIKLSLAESTDLKLETFLRSNAGIWGVSKEAANQASAALHEFVTTLRKKQDMGTIVKFIFMTDEHHFIVDIVYKGQSIPMPDTKPSKEELLNDEKAFEKLAGFLIRKNAERTYYRHLGEFHWLRLVFLQ